MMPHWVIYVAWGLEGLLYALAIAAGVNAYRWARR